jgi:hypothetical protein
MICFRSAPISGSTIATYGGPCGSGPASARRRGPLHVAKHAPETTVLGDAEEHVAVPESTRMAEPRLPDAVEGCHEIGDVDRAEHASDDGVAVAVWSRTYGGSPAAGSRPATLLEEPLAIAIVASAVGRTAM